MSGFKLNSQPNKIKLTYKFLIAWVNKRHYPSACKIGTTSETKLEFLPNFLLYQPIAQLYYNIPPPAPPHKTSEIEGKV